MVHFCVYESGGGKNELLDAEGWSAWECQEVLGRARESQEVPWSAWERLKKIKSAGDLSADLKWRGRRAGPSSEVESLYQIDTRKIRDLGFWISWSSNLADFDLQKKLHTFFSHASEDSYSLS